MSEVYEDILRRIKRYDLLAEICFVVCGMSLFILLALSAILKRMLTGGAAAQQFLPLTVAGLIVGLALAIVSAVLGVRAKRHRAAVQAEKVAYEKKGYVVPVRTRHLSRGQSRRLMAAVSHVESIRAMRVSYVPQRKQPYRVKSTARVAAFFFWICAGMAVLGISFVYAFFLYLDFVPSVLTRLISAIGSAVAFVLLMLRWRRIRKAGYIPVELRRSSKKWRGLEAGILAVVVIAAVYYVMAFGAGRVMHLATATETVEAHQAIKMRKGQKRCAYLPLENIRLCRQTAYDAAHGREITFRISRSPFGVAVRHYVPWHQRWGK